MMRLSTKLWGGLVVGVLLVGLPGGVMGLDGGAVEGDHRRPMASPPHPP